MMSGRTCFVALLAFLATRAAADVEMSGSVLADEEDPNDGASDAMVPNADSATRAAADGQASGSVLADEEDPNPNDGASDAILAVPSGSDGDSLIDVESLLEQEHVADEDSDDEEEEEESDDTASLFEDDEEDADEVDDEEESDDTASLFEDDEEDAD